MEPRSIGDLLNLSSYDGGWRIYPGSQIMSRTMQIHSIITGRPDRDAGAGGNLYDPALQGIGKIFTWEKYILNEGEMTEGA
jgi:hypothetical protein